MMLPPPRIGTLTQNASLNASNALYRRCDRPRESSQRPESPTRLVAAQVVVEFRVASLPAQ